MPLPVAAWLLVPSPACVSFHLPFSQALPSSYFQFSHTSCGDYLHLFPSLQLACGQTPASAEGSVLHFQVRCQNSSLIPSFCLSLATFCGCFRSFLRPHVSTHRRLRLWSLKLGEPSVAIPVLIHRKTKSGCCSVSLLSLPGSTDYRQVLYYSHPVLS